MDIQKLDTNALFTQYVNTVNKALGAHKDEAPYKQFIKLGGKMLDDSKIGVQVYKEDPDTPHHYFTIKFDNGSFDILKQGKEEVDVDWKVKDDHLQRVVSDPQTFIKEPARLDLDWLKSRLNMN